MTSPVNRIKSWLKEQPEIYDRVRPLQRAFSKTEAYKYLDALSRFNESPLSFIQIGANDGLRNDPIREFIVRDEWNGVLVEPLPDVFAKLIENYSARRFSRLHFENVAVSHRDDEVLEFWTYKESFLQALSAEQRLYYLRKSSFDRDHLLQFLEGEAEAAGALQKIDVPCTSVTELALRHFPDGVFDLLVIDAEGHEQVILESLDFNRVRPKVIFFESEHLEKHNGSSLRKLHEAGYRVRKLSGQDSVAESIDRI
ncbi:MAG: FkbM family methyltransferase [Actinomycetota bacterium]